MKRSAGSAVARVSRAKPPALGATAISVRDRIVDTVRHIDQNEAEVVAEVRRAIAEGLRASGALVAETALLIEEVVRGAVAATLQAGTGMLVTVKAVAKGVVLGVSDAGGDVLAAALATTRSAVQAAAAAGASVPAVTWRAVGGLMEAGAEIGANAGQIAGAGARGAIEGAAIAGKQATDLLQSGFAGVSSSIAQVFEGSKTPTPTATTHKVRGRKSTRTRAALKPARHKATPKKPARVSLAAGASQPRAPSKAIKRTRSQVSRTRGR